MIRISIPFLFMIYDSSSIPISDFCICSYFRIFHIFTNLLYTKNLTNLTNLTILQILQPYNLFVDECRTMCRHISYDLLTPGVAAAPRYRMVEIQARRGIDSSQSSVVASQNAHLPGSPHRWNTAYQPPLPPTQQSLNRIAWRNPGSRLCMTQGFYFTHQAAELPPGR